jgi:Bacteriophage probable baseplate hub protein
MPEDQLYSALVVDTRPWLEVADAPTDMLKQLLVSLEVTEQEGGLSTLCAVLDDTADHAGVGLDFAFEFTETNFFKPGAAIRVLTGDAGDPQEVFAGTISAVELAVAEGGEPQLRVFAEDALMAWRMVRRTRTFPAGTVRSIIEALAADTSLTPVITALEEEVDAQQQLNETDLGFLRRLLARYDADAQVVGTELHVSPRALVDRGEVTLALNSQLRAIRVCADLAHQRETVALSGFDLIAGRPEEVTAAETGLGPGAGQTGPSMLADALPGTLERVPWTAFADRSEAQDTADAMQARRMRRFVVADGSATGNSAIRVGTRLVLKGLGPRFSNTYYTTRAVHGFDLLRGYVTQFSAECAFWGMV